MSETGTVLSPERLAANRSNGLKSTGPRTEAGKAIVAMNPLVHGLFCRATVLPLENRREFRAFEKGLQGDLAPVGALEELFADRIVSSAWRLRRLLAVETAATSVAGLKAQQYYGRDVRQARKKEHQLGEEAKEISSSMRWLESNDPLTADITNGSALSETFEALADYFFRRRENPPAAGVPPTPEKPPAKARDLFRAAGWTTDRIRASLRYHLSLKLKTATEGIEAARLDVRTARLEPAARRLPRESATANLVRYEVTIERSLFRALHELQRLQAMRLGAPVMAPIAVDVTVAGEIPDLEPSTPGESARIIAHE